eukprot:7145710-Pyramimonas_sp.AAC.1
MTSASVVAGDLKAGPLRHRYMTTADLNFRRLCLGRRRPSRPGASRGRAAVASKRCSPWSPSGAQPVRCLTRWAEV